jgi:hypothetical protein
LLFCAKHLFVAAIGGRVPIPGEAAHRSGMMPPTHSELISPAVPR